MTNKAKQIKCIGKRIVSVGLAVLLGFSTIATDIYAIGIDSEVGSEGMPPEHTHEYADDGYCECGEFDESAVKSDDGDENQAGETSTDGESGTPAGDESDETEHIHDYDDNGMCECGAVDLETHIHNYDDNGICECGEVDAEIHEHTFIDGVCICGMDEETWLAESDIPVMEEGLVPALGTSSLAKPVLKVVHPQDYQRPSFGRDSDYAENIFWDNPTLDIEAPALRYVKFELFKATSEDGEYTLVYSDDVDGEADYTIYQDYEVPVDPATGNQSAAYYKLVSTDSNGGTNVSYADNTQIVALSPGHYYYEEDFGTYVDLRFLDADGNPIDYQDGITIHEGESIKLGIGLVDRSGNIVSYADALDAKLAENEYYTYQMDDAPKWTVLTPSTPGDYTVDSMPGARKLVDAYFAHTYYGDESNEYVEYNLTKEAIYAAQAVFTGHKSTDGSHEYFLGIGIKDFEQSTLAARIKINVIPAVPGQEYYHAENAQVTSDADEYTEYVRESLINRSATPICTPKELMTTGALSDFESEREGMKPWEGDYLNYTAFFPMFEDEMTYEPVDFLQYFRFMGKEYKWQENTGYFPTNAEQEQYVTDRVNELLHSGDLAAAYNSTTMSKEQKVYEIYKWIVAHVGSTPGALDRRRGMWHTAYSALYYGHGTCQAYALLFTRLTREMGIPSKIIMGTDADAHTYNIVLLDDGYYYYVDTSAGIWKQDYNTFQKTEEQIKFTEGAFLSNYIRKIKGYGASGSVYVVKKVVGQDDVITSFDALLDANEYVMSDIAPYYASGVNIPKYIVTLNKDLTVKGNSELYYSKQVPDYATETMNNYEYSKYVELDLNGHILTTPGNSYYSVFVSKVYNGTIKIGDNTELILDGDIWGSRYGWGTTESVYSNVTFESGANSYLILNPSVTMEADCNLDKIGNLYMYAKTNVKCDVTTNNVILNIASSKSGDIHLDGTVNTKYLYVLSDGVGGSAIYHFNNLTVTGGSKLYKGAHIRVKGNLNLNNKTYVLGQNGYNQLSASNIFGFNVLRFNNVDWNGNVPWFNKSTDEYAMIPDEHTPVYIELVQDASAMGQCNITGTINEYEAFGSYKDDATYEAHRYYLDDDIAYVGGPGIEIRKVSASGVVSRFGRGDVIGSFTGVTGVRSKISPASGAVTTTSSFSEIKETVTSDNVDKYIRVTGSDCKAEVDEGLLWMKVPYQTVIFDAGKGTVAIASKRYETNEAHTIAYGTLPEATRRGYAFAGWYSDPEVHTDETKVTESSMVNSDGTITLYAGYTPNKYDVTLNTKGGTFVSPVLGTYLKYVTNPETLESELTATVEFEQPYKSLVGTLPIPVRRGYSFAGWSLDSAGKKPVGDETIVITGDNHTLYAQWTSFVATITLDSVMDDVYPVDYETSKQIQYDSAYGTKYSAADGNQTDALPVLSKRGYRFDYWYRLDGPMGAETEVRVDNNTKMAEVDDHTLYAHWTPDLHVVTFTVPSYSGRTTEGAPVSIPAHVYAFNVLDNYSLDEMLADNVLSSEMNSAAHGSANNAQISNKEWTWERILGVADNDALCGADWIYEDDTLFDTDTKITSDIAITAVWFDVNRLDAPVFGDIDAEYGALVQLGVSEDVWSVVEGTPLIITAEPGAKIHYTTDGSDPDQFSQVYEGPIVLKVGSDYGDVDGSISVTDADSDGVIRIQAIAVAENRKTSEVSEIKIHILDAVTSGDIVGEDAEHNDLTEEGYIDEFGRPYVPEGLWAHVVDKIHTYSGNAVKPEVRVYYGNKLLVQGSDYTLTYRNNVNVSDPDAIESKQPYVTIKGRGKYTGKCTKYFQIEGVSISAEGTPVSVSSDTVVAYNGRAQQPTFTVTNNGKKLVQGRDYAIRVIGGTYASGGSVRMDASCIDAGTYTCTVAGIGNYSGSVERSFIITNAIPLSRVTVSSIKGKDYNGSPITLNVDPETKEVTELIVKYNFKRYKVAASKDDAETYNSLPDTEESDKYKLYLDSDTYVHHTEVGTASVVIKTLNTSLVPTSSDEVLFYGEKTINYRINPISISGATITGVSDSYSYTGREIQPGIGVKKGSRDVASSNYTVTYKNNVNAGTATITVKGKGNYTGSVKRTFRIEELDLAANRSNVKVYNETHYPEDGGYTEVDMEASYWMDMTYQYNKSGNEPLPIIFYMVDADTDIVLTPGEDYRITYTGNQGLTGSTPATMTITGRGNFKGSFDMNFDIKGAPIENLYASAADVVYKAKSGAWKSTIVIKEADGTALKAGVDYDPATLRYEYVNRVKLTSKVSRKPGDEVRATDIPPVGTVIKVSVRAKENGNYDTMSGEGAGTAGCGTISTTYRIVRATLGLATVNVQTQTYKGVPVVPKKSEISVKVGRTILKTTDYDIVSVTGNTKTGFATMVIRGTGEYGGTKTVRFRIK